MPRMNFYVNFDIPKEIVGRIERPVYEAVTGDVVGKAIFEEGSPCRLGLLGFIYNRVCEKTIEETVGSLAFQWSSLFLEF